MALACLACGYAGWHAHSVVTDAARVREMEQTAEIKRQQEEAAYQASAKLEARLAQLQAQNRQLNRSLARETQNPAYACVLPPDGLRLLNTARIHTVPASEPVDVLP